MDEPVLILSSSDEAGEADGDFAAVESLAGSKRRAPQEGGSAAKPTVIHLSSSCEDDPQGGTEATAAGLGKRRKWKKKKKKNKKADVRREEEAIGTVDSVVTEVNDASDNVILRRLLRGPRYFDSGSSNLETCYNCGEEGHKAADCTMEKRQKPCFVCGMFGHNAKQCVKASKRRSHLAKECPEKHKMIAHDAAICLWCGDQGHDMLSCFNGYDPDDLKEIQCYICKAFGHLCCVDFVDLGAKEVACYNCAQFDHSGLGCAKSRGESIAVQSPILCYKCGEEGHFARGCTKNAKSREWLGESSTSDWKFSKGSRDCPESRSVPHDFWGKHNKRSLQNEERWNVIAGKSRPKGSWIVDGPDDWPNEIPRARTKGGWLVDDPADWPNEIPGTNGWIPSPTKHRKKGEIFSSHSKESGDLLGPTSVPRDYWRKRNKRNLHHEDRLNLTAGKSRPKGGSIVDDPGDWPNEIQRSNGWIPSPSKHRKRHNLYSSDSGGHYSNSSSYRKHKPFEGPSTSHFTSSSYQNEFSRFNGSYGHSQRS